MEAYSYGLRHRDDKRQWTMGPRFETKGKAERAAHDVKSAKSDDYDRVIVYKCSPIVIWDIGPAPKPAPKPHKAHRSGSKHK